MALTALQEFRAQMKRAHAPAHGGYDPTYANTDPNRVLPIDVLREMEKRAAR